MFPEKVRTPVTKGQSVSKLFTRTDLERAARLAAFGALLSPKSDPEVHINAAVTTVANEAPTYYDEHTIRDILGPDALRALLDCVDHRPTRD